MAKSARRNDTVFSRIFDVFNVIFLAAVAAITVLPFIYVLACSFATEREILEKPFFIIPSEIQALAGLCASAKVLLEGDGKDAPAPRK